MFQFNTISKNWNQSACVKYWFKIVGSKIGEVGIRKFFSKDWITLRKLDLCKLCVIEGDNAIGDGGLQIVLSRVN